MTKKILFISIIIVALAAVGIIFTKDNKQTEPEITQIKAIFKLATLKASYHNVAKSTKKAGSEWDNWGEKEREFWVEYTGYATIGVNMERVTMVVKKDKITITMPRAEVFNCSYDEKSLKTYEDKDGFINSNKVGTEDRKEAVKGAQEKMKKEVEQNASLMNTAEERAKELIENYINQLGELSGTDYEITWKTLEEN